MAELGDGGNAAAAADQPTPGPEADLHNKRLAHWPYSAERSKALIDLDSLNQQAVHVLARSLASERLVAFVGAGVSMAYGRMTWRGLMTQLYELVQASVQAGNPIADERWKQLTKALWPARADFDDYADQPMKAQLLSVVLELLREDGRQEPAGDPAHPDEAPAKPTEALRRWTALLVADHMGFVTRTLNRPALQTKPTPQTPSSRDLEVQMRALQVQSRPKLEAADPARPVGLGEVVSTLLDVLAETGGAPVNRSSLAERLLLALGRPSVDQDSPLRQLALDWGIRRFLTTNYDTEIERALAHLGFEQHHTDSSVVHGNQFVKLTFDQHSTGRAMAFAVEGPRRHAAVLHLHGDASDPDSLVIGETHYQRLYLDDHATRDLVSNAVMANFAANPVLFVGSDVSEEDVLRPMRQFMSGVGHRRDRMAVALFATTNERKQRAQRQAALLLKYGVFALFYGEASGDVQPHLTVQLKNRDEPWLFRFWSISVGFEKWRSAWTDAKPGSAQPPADTWSLDLRWLAAPSQLEGQSVSGPGATHPELDFSSRFNAMKKTVLALARASAKAAPDRQHLDRAALLLEVTRDWIMGLFLSAKLISLRKQCSSQRRDDFKLALPYTRPPESKAASPSLGLRVQFRHRVQVGHDLLVGRFSAPREVVIGTLDADVNGGKKEPVLFDDGIGALCKAVKGHWPAPIARPRRVVVVTSSRGQGKGGQFDRLALEPWAADGSKLLDLLTALGDYKRDGQWCYAHVLHVNLSFSNELGTLIGQLAALLRSMAIARLGEQYLRSRDWQDRCTDQLEDLRRGLQCLCAQPEKPTRLLLVLGNAGVLFDAAGQPKNGLIQRVLRLLMSGQFAQAPLDILMYTGESQVPADLRQRPPDGTTPVFGVLAPHRTDLSSHDLRALRRYDRLNLGTTPALSSRVLLHPLPRTRLVWLAASYFPDLALALGWAQPVDREKADGQLRPVEEWTPTDREARRLYLPAEAAGLH